MPVFLSPHFFRSLHLVFSYSKTCPFSCPSPLRLTDGKERHARYFLNVSFSSSLYTSRLVLWVSPLHSSTQESIRTAPDLKDCFASGTHEHARIQGDHKRPDGTYFVAPENHFDRLSSPCIYLAHLHVKFLLVFAATEWSLTLFNSLTT